MEKNDLGPSRKRKRWESFRRLRFRLVRGLSAGPKYSAQLLRIKWGKGLLILRHGQEAAS
jgi:hypothetical protein